MKKTTGKGPRAGAKSSQGGEGRKTTSKAAGGKAARKTGKPAQRGASTPGWMPEAMVKPARTGGRATASGKPARGQADTDSTAARRGPQRDPNHRREAQRYAEPIASRDFILQVLAGQAEFLSIGA